MFKKKIKRIFAVSLATMCVATGLMMDVNFSEAAVKQYSGGTKYTVDIPTETIWYDNNRDVKLTVVEGTCSDGKTMYYMRTGESQWNGTRYQALYKIDATNPNAKPQRLAFFSCLSHANDITYCPKNGFIYIAPGAGNGHKGVYMINPNNTSEFYYGATLGYNVAAISYNSSTERFYVREKNDNDMNKATIHVYDCNFKKEKEFTITKRSSDEKWQGLETHGDYLYTITSGRTKYNESFIYTYSLNSQSKLSRTSFIKKNQNYFEIEGLTFINNKPYASLNYTGNKDRVVKITSGLSY